MSVIINTKSLSAGYRKRKSVTTVLRNVDLELHEGELVSLLGANGAGKSTLIRTICGLQPALAGRVMVGDKDVERLTPRQLSKTIALVTTERTFAGGLTVSELVGLGRHPHTGFLGRLDEHDRQIVATAIEKVGISHKSESYVAELSDGERQKVMIAKALAQETPVIFLDEPTAFLDFPSKIEMMQLLWRLSRQTHKTIFLSTHDLDLALQIADRVWLMDREQGITVGTPEDLTLDGRLARFFQRKGMAFNSANGLYEVAYQFRTSIRLIGAEQPVRMVAKALRRNGVASGSTIASERWIEATAEGFRLHEPDGTVCHFATIDQLLQALRPLFQQIANDIE